MKLSKPLIFRTVGIIAIILLAILMYYVGRQHTILVDNKTVTLADGTEIKALQTVEVQVDKQEKMELAARDRDQYIVTSQSHKFTITYTDDMWEEHTVTKRINVPSSLDTVIISIPTLAHDPEAPQSAWLTEFIPPKIEIVPQEEEKIVTDDAFTM